MKPVLLVHGWSDSHIMPWWDKIEDTLRDKGFENVRTVELGLPGLTIGSPAKYARQVRREAMDLHNSTGQNISIIGHSMGGLCSRYFVEILGGHNIVDNVLTMGTPHKGTNIAYLGIFSKGGRQMRIKSDFMKKLNKEGLHESVNYTALWSDNDMLIDPIENAKLPASEMDSNDKNIKISGVGHLMMVMVNDLFEEYHNYISRCVINR